MVFKKEAVLERLAKLNETLAVLKKYQTVEWERYEADIELQWIVERGFILTAEMAFDIGAHILAGEFSIYPDSYEDIIKGLGEKGILPRNLASKLKGFAGFRNVLVHEYTKLDQKIVYRALREDLNHLQGFLKSLCGWIKTQ